jgi:hypothetical protein
MEGIIWDMEGEGSDNLRNPEGKEGEGEGYGGRVRRWDEVQYIRDGA